MNSILGSVFFRFGIDCIATRKKQTRIYLFDQYETRGYIYFNKKKKQADKPIEDKGQG